MDVGEGDGGKEKQGIGGEGGRKDLPSRERKRLILQEMDGEKNDLRHR